MVHVRPDERCASFYMQQYNIAVYWKPRQEDLSDCVSRCVRQFQGLARVSVQFSQWFGTGSTRAQALQQPIEAQSSPAIRDLLLKGVHRRDVGGAVIPELGYSLALWNGRPAGSQASARVACGLRTTAARTLISSSALTIELEAMRTGSDKSLILDCFKSLIDAWDPETGRIWQTAWAPDATDPDAKRRDLVHAEYRASALPSLPDKAIAYSRGFLLYNPEASLNGGHSSHEAAAISKVSRAVTCARGDNR